MSLSLRNLTLARRARAYGARSSLRIIIEAHAAGVPVSLAFAIFEHESGFQAVFGHDPTIFVGAGLVTKAKYIAYRNARRASGNREMQGVGYGQLTWWATQDAADREGGCWRTPANVRIALRALAANLKQYGLVLGVARYNGYGPAADRYSAAVRARARVWHARLS